MSDADELPEFGTVEYWEAEYKANVDEAHYDWLMSYDECSAIVEEHLLNAGGPTKPVMSGKWQYDGTREDEKKYPQFVRGGITILHLGNGNSTVPEQLLLKGYENQLVTEVSPSCVERMRRDRQNDLERRIHLVRILNLPRKLPGFDDEAAVGGYAMAAEGDGDTVADAAGEVWKASVAWLRQEDGYFGFLEYAGDENNSDEQKPLPRASDARNPLVYLTADAREVDHVVSDDSFDVVFEKACYDAMFCGDDHALDILKVVKQAWKLMKHSFISISMHKPEEMALYLKLKCFDWQVRCYKVEDACSGTQQRREKGDSKHQDGCSGTQQRRITYHYVYICEGKTAESLRVMEEHWRGVFAHVTEVPDVNPPVSLTDGKIEVLEFNRSWEPPSDTRHPAAGRVSSCGVETTEA